jgi:hypothetical protein
MKQRFAKALIADVTVHAAIGRMSYQHAIHIGERLGRPLP